MAEIPSASLTIDDEAGAFAGTTGYIAVLAAVPTNDDVTPRVYSSAKGVLTQHGYSQGASYVASHIEETGLPVLFVGLPIVTAGTVGRQNSEGVTGTSRISVAAGADGALEDGDWTLTVTTGGTVGTSQIAFTLSDGRVTKAVRLGTATSYVIPYIGVTLSFAAGTLVAGDVFTFSTKAGRWDAAGLTSARTALAEQQKLVRSFLVVGDLVDSDDADDVVAEANAYETSNDRFVYARTSAPPYRTGVAMAKHVVGRMTGSPTLTFAEVGATGDTITRSAGSWVTDGFAVGDFITVSGSASNNVTGVIAALTPTVITLDTTDLVAEGPASNCTVVAYEGLTFAEVGSTGDTITRSRGSWLADGFKVGDTVTITGSASNNVSGAIAALTSTVLTFNTTDLSAETIGADDVTITTSQTMAAYVAAQDAEFASVDAERRIDISLETAFKKCPITGWKLLRPASWAASIREYQHDVHIPCWRKADGPLSGWDLEDADGNVVRYDERTDGGALAGRFTCFRTWANGPNGTFLALSLTRASEGSLLSRTHNMAVTNVACTVCQAETENAIGQVLALKDDGKATEASLSLIEQRVNSSLSIALLQDKGEGPRASKAVWRCSRNDILNVPGATLTGTLELLLNGTIEKISTRVRIQTAGA